MSGEEFWTEISGKSDKHAKKLAKKAAKGECSTKQCFVDCYSLSIRGHPTLSIELDKSRENTRHNLNLSEVRDLILSVFSDKQPPKYFAVKNKSFLRNVIVFHISECNNPDEAIRAIGIGRKNPLHLRVSRQDNEANNLPQKLLSLSIEEAEDLQEMIDTAAAGGSVLSPSATGGVAGVGVAVGSKEQRMSSIDLYIMSEAMMQTWGFPLPATSAQMLTSVASGNSSTGTDNSTSTSLVSVDRGATTGDESSMLEDEEEEVEVVDATAVEVVTAIPSTTTATAKSKSTRSDSSDTANDDDNAQASKRPRVEESIHHSENPAENVPENLHENLPSSGGMASLSGLIIGSLPTRDDAKLILTSSSSDETNAAATALHGGGDGVIDANGSGSGQSNFPLLTVQMLDTKLDNFISTVPSTSDAFKAIAALWEPGTVPVPPIVADAAGVVGSLYPLQAAAVDCEMCDTAEGLELTRLTVVDAKSRVVLDTLVKPRTEIINYRTQWSGITKERMDNVTVTLAQAQVAFLRLVSAETVLVGHGLENDLRALKIAHTRCVDTSVIYAHPRGFPLRYKLKALAHEHLKIMIQRGGAGTFGGHDSAEDAGAAMKLVQLKVEKGPKYGLKGGASLREPLVAFLGKQASAQTSSLQGTAAATPYSDLSSLSSAFFIGDSSLKKSMAPCVAHPGVTVSVSVAATTPAAAAASVDVSSEVTVNEACEFIAKNIGVYSSPVSNGEKSGSNKTAAAGRPPRPTFCFVGVKCGSSSLASSVSSSLLSSTSILASSSSPESAGAVVGLAAQVPLTFPGIIPPAEAEAYASLRDAVEKIKQASKSAAAPSSSSSGTMTENSGGRQTSSGTLLIVTAQSSISTVSALYKRRKTSQNPQATLVWTNALERQLKEAQAKSNIASIALAVL